MRLTIASFCSLEYRTPFFFHIDRPPCYLLNYNTKVSYDIYPNRGERVGDHAVNIAEEVIGEQ